jgi:hypothetical protein
MVIVMGAVRAIDAADAENTLSASAARRVKSALNRGNSWINSILKNALKPLYPGAGLKGVKLL